MSRMYSSFSTKHSRVNGLSPLDRKTPRNPKYAGVRSTLDTGASLSKVDIITNRQYLNRKGELFKRVSAATLCELLDEHAEEQIGESIFEMGQQCSWWR